MCLIIVKPSGVAFPKDDFIRNADENNDDGIGIALHKKGATRISIKKDFKNVNDFLEWAKVSVSKEDGAIIHFRFATSGKTDAGNRHPFPITKSKELLRQTELRCRWAVAHNGVITKYSGHKKYSDTQKFIMDMLADPAIKFQIYNKNIQKLVAEFISTDKLAIMDKEGRIILIGTYTKGDDGCFYSNSSHTYKKTTYQQGFNYGGYCHRGLYNYDDDSTVANDKDDKDDGYDDDGHVDVCEGCGQKKFVRAFELENAYYYLCKKCRREARKGKLGVDNILVQCDSCLDFFDKTDTCWISDSRYCLDCAKEWSQGNLDNVEQTTVLPPPLKDGTNNLMLD
jgi:predicted glutamine amidotransferase